MIALLLLSLAVTVTPLEQAQALEANGDDRAARELLEQAVNATPTWAMGRVELGRVELKLGESEAAFHHLDVARSLAPENPRAHYLFALAADELGYRLQSRHALEVALKLRRGFSDAQMRLASVLSAEGEFSHAVDTLRPYVTEHPEATSARFQLADLLERAGDLNGAENQLRVLFERPNLKQLAGKRLIALLEKQQRGHDADQVRQAIDPPRRQLRQLQPSRR